MGSDCQLISECCDWVQPAEAAVFERAVNVDTDVKHCPSIAEVSYSSLSLHQGL